MNILLFSSGVLLLLLVAHDLVTTVLSPNGAGWLTRRLGAILWSILLRLRRITQTRALLSLGGTLIMLSVLLVWLLGIWLATTMMIASEERSIINMETNTSATLVSKIYYTGYTLSTLGNGDLEPGNPFWEVFTALFSFTGLIFISTAITYLIPVLSAEIEKQRLSVYIATLGCSVSELIQQTWNGKDLCALATHISPLTGWIIHHTQNHHVYPILHYFHTERKKDAFVLNITNLDEMLTLIALVPETQRPTNQELQPLRHAISHYLATVQQAYIRATPTAPPLPNLSELPVDLVVDQTAWQEHYEYWAERRKLLQGLIQNDGWEWNDLLAGSQQSATESFEPYLKPKQFEYR